MSTTPSSSSSKITLKEYLAKCVAEIRREEEAERRKIIRREIKLEKERQKKLEEAERLAEEEARAEAALCPPLPSIGSRYPMNHFLKISYWPDPAPVSKTPISLASSYRAHAPLSLSFQSTGSRALAATAPDLPEPPTLPLATPVPAPPTLPQATPVPAPPIITSPTVAAPAVVSPAAKSASKRQMSARKKLHIDMVMDESPLPTKRGRNVANYFKK